jgi:hypothetical protein
VCAENESSLAIVVTVIATGFEDKPSSQGRKATSTGFGSSVNSSSNHQSGASAKEDTTISSWSSGLITVPKIIFTSSSAAS